MPDSFAEAVERRVKGFDPEGAGYDDETAAELDKLMPLTMDKPEPPEDPSKTAYRANEGAFKAWVWHPEKNDWVIHSSSRDPRTGQLLKGRKHKTWDLLEEGEANEGYTIYKDPKSGRYFSTDGSYLGGSEK